MATASIWNLKDPSAPDQDELDFMQAQKASGALPTLPIPAQGPTTLQNPILMNQTPNVGKSPVAHGPTNKSSDTQTQQSAQTRKTFASDEEWKQLQEQAMSSPALQDLKRAIDDQDLQAKSYADRMSGRDTNNYSAIGAAADNLNQLNGTQSNYASALEKQASANDPKKIQDEILKNFADVSKSKQGLATDTLNATKDMQTGNVSNKLVDAQMAGLQAFNPQMINQRNNRMFEQQRDALLKESTPIASSLRSLGNVMNQLGSTETLTPAMLEEVNSVANTVAGAGAGLGVAERSAMGIDNLQSDLTKLHTYLSSPQTVPGGLSNPVVKNLIERIKSEQTALTQQYENRVNSRLNNNRALYDLDPRYEPDMRAVGSSLLEGIKPTTNAQNVVKNYAGFGKEPLSLSQSYTGRTLQHSPGMTVNLGDRVVDPKDKSVHQFLGGDPNSANAWAEVK